MHHLFRIGSRSRVGIDNIRNMGLIAYRMRVASRTSSNNFYNNRSENFSTLLKGRIIIPVLQVLVFHAVLFDLMRGGRGKQVMRSKIIRRDMGAKRCFFCSMCDRNTGGGYNLRPASIGPKYIYNFSFPPSPLYFNGQADTLLPHPHSF